MLGGRSKCAKCAGLWSLVCRGYIWGCKVDLFSQLSFQAKWGHVTGLPATWTVADSGSLFIIGLLPWVSWVLLFGELRPRAQCLGKGHSRSQKV